MAFHGTPTFQETDGICWECTILECSWAISWGKVLKNSCFSGSAEYFVVGGREGAAGREGPPFKGFLMYGKVEVNIEKASLTQDIISATSPFQF